MSIVQVVANKNKYFTIKKDFNGKVETVKNVPSHAINGWLKKGFSIEKEHTIESKINVSSESEKQKQPKQKAK